MTDCSLNCKFNTWKFQAQTWGEHVVYRNFTQHVLPMFCKKKSFWQRFTCMVRHGQGQFKIQLECPFSEKAMFLPSSTSIFFFWLALKQEQFFGTGSALLSTSLSFYLLRSTVCWFIASVNKKATQRSFLHLQSNRRRRRRRRLPPSSLGGCCPTSIPSATVCINLLDI